MTTIELQSFEEQVLEWIRQSHPVTTTQLLEAHRGDRARLSGELLRRAVWNVVDRGLLRYDDEWCETRGRSAIDGTALKYLYCGFRFGAPGGQ